jgi:hypothetical protein
LDTQSFSEERIGGWITTGIEAYKQITAGFSGGMEHMGLDDIWNNGVLRTTVSVLERGIPTQNFVGAPSFLGAIGDARRWLGDCDTARFGMDAAYSLALVITKPPETVLLVLKESGGASVLFDSHSRAQRGVPGAHAVRFTNDRAAAAGLSALFPPTPGLEDCGYGAEMLNQFEATPLRRSSCVVKPEAPTLRGQRAVANAGPAFAAADADADGERGKKKGLEPTVENTDAARHEGQRSKDEPYGLVEGKVEPPPQYLTVMVEGACENATGRYALQGHLFPAAGRAPSPMWRSLTPCGGGTLYGWLYRGASGRWHLTPGQDTGDPWRWPDSVRGGTALLASDGPIPHPAWPTQVGRWLQRVNWTIAAAAPPFANSDSPTGDPTGDPVQHGEWAAARMACLSDDDGAAAAAPPTRSFSAPALALIEPTAENAVNADAASHYRQRSKDEPYGLIEGEVEGEVVPKTRLGDDDEIGDHGGGGEDDASAGGGVSDVGCVGALRAALEKARDDLAASEAARSELANRNAALEAGLAAKQGQLEALQGGLAEAHRAAADLRRKLREAEVRGSRCGCV